jgi:hypothetical protein
MRSVDMSAATQRYDISTFSVKGGALKFLEKRQRRDVTDERLSGAQAFQGERSCEGRKGNLRSE